MRIFEKQVEVCREEAGRLGETLRDELVIFEQQRRHDMKSMLTHFVISQIEHSKRVEAMWTSVLANVNRIAGA